MGAVPLYVNRRLMLEFLSPLVSTPGADNKLETWLWRHLSSKEVVALLRACTLFQLLFSGQMRWLSGKHLSLESWSPVSEAEVLNLTPPSKIGTGICFLDHMVDQFTCHHSMSS